jgi:hypothetical protein
VAAVVIRPELSRESVVAGLRSAWAQGKALQVPDALAPAAAAGLRALVLPSLQPFFLADRGRYRHAPCDDARLLTSLRALAAAVAQEELQLAEARWVLLEPGGYALFQDARGGGAQRRLELVLDASAARAQGGALVYSAGGQALATVPQAPCSLTLVERAPGVLRQQRYVPLSQGPAQVLRLFLQLDPHPAG